MTLSRKSSLWALPALALWASACGTTATSPTDATSSASPTPTPTPSVYAITVDPVTVTASPSTDGNYAWSGSFVATFHNGDTTPITLRSITADLQQSSGGIVITPIVGTDESFRFNIRAPGNRIDINGDMNIPFTFFYTLPNGGKEAIVTMSFAITTDLGAAGSVTATANFQ
jgi:hypothetical protein